MQIEKLHKLFTSYPLIATDTRKELKGSIFFCLSGDNFNGNKFAEQAIEKGAAYVVVDDKNHWKDLPSYILVDDSLKTLQSLALFHRKQFSIPLIGITGTNGKTTTKELIAAVLSSKYNIIATPGNFNNHIGVPLTLLQITEETEIAVVEMGANHPDEIEFLCQLALPNHGVITNIGKAHLEGFGSLEAIKRTKLALYKAVATQQGVLFVNYDDSVLKKESKGLYAFSYGSRKEYDIQGKITNEFPFLEMNWGFKSKERLIHLKTNLFGSYNFTNVMAAVAIGQHFQLSPKEISTAISKYQPKNNRSQFIKGDKNELILDAYNANPESLNIALNNFAKDKFTDKVVILGDMFELGKFASAEHKLILESLSRKLFIKIILVGKEFKKFENNYPDFSFYENTSDLVKELESIKLFNKRILIKGSRGVKLEVLQDYLL